MIQRVAFGASLVAAIIAAVYFYQSASQSSRSSGDIAAYSVRRFDPYGMAALRDLLIERGVKVRSLETPNLRMSDRGVLIQTLQMPRSRGRREEIPAQKLLDWIRDGNVVIQLTRGPTDLMARAKIVPSTAPSEEEARHKVEDFEQSGGSPASTPARVTLAPLESAAQGAADTTELALWSPMVLEETPNMTWTPIARSGGKDGKSVAAQAKIGLGMLVIVGAPTPALNGMIGEHGNLDFLLSQIGRRTVIFDEWSHGIGHEATIIGFIHDVGLVPLLLQVIFIAGIYVWSTYGYPPRGDSQAPRRRSSVEQIKTLGFLYGRSFNSDVTFNYVNSEVMRRLAGALHCRPGEVARRVKLLKPDSRAKCDALFGQLERLRPAHGPRCVSCGYELYLLSSDRCPECGVAISPELQQRILQATRTGPPGAVESRRMRFDPAFAAVLTASHQLSQEVERDRSAL